MKNVFFVMPFIVLLFGCSGQSVKTFDDVGLGEQELASVSAYEEGGLFGTSVSFKTVDGKKVSGFFDKKVETVKVTPGKHVYEMKFHDRSFSLFDSDQHLLVAFEFEAIGGHEYIVHFEMEKSVGERLSIGGDFAGWIEDKTTGKRIPMNRPGL